jgi:hypothetical protein
MLQVTSGYSVNNESFDKYAMGTSKYSWYYTPTSIHKIFIHGSKIISVAILPTGQLSEEVQRD